MNLSVLASITCDEGSAMLTLVSILKFVITAIQWIVPVLLILFGTIDLVRAVTAGKEEEIKKHQKALAKRAISAVIVFLIPLAVKVVMGLIGSEDWKGCWNDAPATIDISALGN